MKTIKIIIDRFEGDFSVVELENGTTVDMPGLLIPKGAKEGDILKISIDEDETENRKKRIKKMYEELWNQ